jgi:hypothetical protein
MNGDMIPQFTFATPEHMAIFWNDVYMILLFAMPFLVIWAATKFGGDLLRSIRRAFSQFGPSGNRQDYEGKKHDDIKQSKYKED